MEMGRERFLLPIQDNLMSSSLQTEKISPSCARKCFGEGEGKRERESVVAVFIALMILFVVLGIELIPALIPGERLFILSKAG